MKEGATRKIGPLERQRDEAVQDVIRYGGGFGWSEKPCFGCYSSLTAKAPDGRWACPYHWPVVQLRLGA